MGLNDPVKDQLIKRPSPPSFGKKRAHLSFSMSIEWMRVQAHDLRMHFSICFDKEHRGQIFYWLLMVMSLNDNILFRIDSLCPHPDIQNEGITKS